MKRGAIISSWLIALLIPAMVAMGREIKGQVFIVTQGGPAIKLALAQIYVVSPEGMKQAEVERVALIDAIDQEKQRSLNQVDEDRKTNVGDKKDSLSLQFAADFDRSERAIKADYANKLLRIMSAPPKGTKPARLADADGNFKVEAPADAVLLIHAERQTPHEVYRWVLTVAELSTDGEPIMFSNHNLFVLARPK